MTQEEILKGNKLIAEFMGNKFTHCSSIKCVKYHSSWDWLMPVVEKIETFPFITTIITSGCRISMWEESVPYEWINVDFEDIYSFGGKYYVRTKIEATWLTVVEFIKWYNKNKKS